MPADAPFEKVFSKFPAASAAGADAERVARSVEHCVACHVASGAMRIRERMKLGFGDAAADADVQGKRRVSFQWR